MLIGLALLLLSLALALPAGASGRRSSGWFSPNPGWMHGDNLACNDAGQVWVASSTHGWVGFSNDGGATWTHSYTEAWWTDDIVSAAAGHASVVGCDLGDERIREAVIATTTDGGATWTGWSTQMGMNASLDGVDFVDASHGWAVGSYCRSLEGDPPKGLIVATTDGGVSWSQKYLGSVGSAAWEDLYDVAFSDASHGWAVGEGADSATARSKAVILATTNGGATWSRQRPASSARLFKVDFTDASHGWALGCEMPSGTNVILATKDGGVTWTKQNPGTEAGLRLNGIAFANASCGWAVGQNGTILATTNGGAGWSAQQSGTSGDLGEVAFTDSSHGWATGWEPGHDIFLATTTGGGVAAVAPALDRFTPSSGPAGSSVTLTGSGFSGASAVAFDGKAARFAVASSTKIRAIVPAGATSGSIAVTAPGGGCTGTALFTVTTAKPTLTKLSPAAGKRGATVTLTGRNFGKRRNAGYVLFGTQKCTKYVSWTNTGIKCKVPARAKSGKLKVAVVASGGASNARAFSVKR